MVRMFLRPDGMLRPAQRIQEGGSAIPERW